MVMTLMQCGTYCSTQYKFAVQLLIQVEILPSHHPAQYRTRVQPVVTRKYAPAGARGAAGPISPPTLPLRLRAGAHA